MPAAPPENLHRALRFVDVYGLALGGVIGTGIFFLPGKAAAQLGPAALLALLIGAVLAGLLVLCFAEAGSRYASTGGAMTYARAAFGDAPGFIVGWAIWSARVVSWAALANAFVTALTPLWPAADAYRPALLIALFAALTAGNLAGVAVGARLNTLLTAAKLIPLLVFIAVGLFAIDGAGFTPFAPQGLTDLGSTTVLMFYAYVGFEGLVVPAAEMRNPQRAVPRALLAGMATICLLYLLIWAVCTGTLTDLAGAENPVGDAARSFLGPAGGAAMQVGILISVVGINAFMALVTPRALYALARFGLLPPWLAATDRRNTPHGAIWCTGALALALALTGTFEQLAVISIVARLAQYIATCLAVLALRRREDAPPAAFRAPFGPVLPWLAIATCGWLLVETERERLLWGAVAVFGGLVLYLPWRRRTGPLTTPPGAAP